MTGRIRFAILALFVNPLVLLVPLTHANHNQSQTAPSIHATVRLAVCGNQIAETGEECDQTDLRGATCTSIGFAEGFLQCHPSCSFDINSCQFPVTRTTIDEFSIFFTNGIFDIPSWASQTLTPSFNVIEQTIIQTRNAVEASFVTLPEDLLVERHDGGFFDATALTVAELNIQTISGLEQNVEAKAALQWGIPNVTLTFSIPVTIHMAVDQTLNNQTLSIVRSTTGTSNWTNDGIVPPATCTVTKGVCEFQITRASYFATVVVPSTSPSSSSTSTTTSSSSSDSSSTTTSTTSSSDTPTNSPTPTRRVVRQFSVLPPTSEPESIVTPFLETSPKANRQDAGTDQPSMYQTVRSRLQRKLLEIWRYVLNFALFIFRAITSWFT